MFSLGRKKTNAEISADKFYSKIRKLECLTPIGDRRLEVNNTSFVLIVRPFYSSINNKRNVSVFFVNKEQFTGRYSSYDEFSAWEEPFEFSEEKAVPHFIDVMESMPEELQEFIAAYIGDFIDADFSSDERRFLTFDLVDYFD